MVRSRRLHFQERLAEAGYLLRRLQQGNALSMPWSRPMSSIGPRCHELRIDDENKTWRIVCRIDEDAIVIVKLFRKKTQQTSKRTVALSQKRLEKKGWRIGEVDEFLGLSEEESEFIELKLKLSEAFRSKRQQKGLTQVEIARTLRSSQSRVAKMEAGDPSVSVDLLIRALFALGTTRREIGRVVSSRERSSAT